LDTKRHGPGESAVLSIAKKQSLNMFSKLRAVPCLLLSS